MRIIRLFFPLLLLFIQTVSGQSVITVQSGINMYLYSTLDSALNYAVAGDQIFIPGGVFNVNNLYIHKSVMIFGAGHYADSSQATGITMLNGNVNLISGASGGLLTGCYVSGKVIVGNGFTGSDSVSNYTISRCNVDTLAFSFTGAPPTNARNFSVSENIIRGSVLGANAVNLNFSRNIIQGSVEYFNGNSSFVNNDFIGLGNCAGLDTFMNNVSSVTFENNIFLYSTPVCSTAAFIGTACNNNIFSNNLLRMTITFPQGTNTGFSNLTNQAVASTLVNALGDVFNYIDNYHLKSTSPGVHAATDGNDIGIYGTSQPYKISAVPFNPHIQQKSISPSTNLQGQLNIQIHAAAQDY